MKLENLNLTSLNLMEVTETNGGEQITNYQGGDLREPLRAVGNFLSGVWNGLVGRE